MFSEAPLVSFSRALFYSPVCSEVQLTKRQAGMRACCCVDVDTLLFIWAPHSSLISSLSVVHSAVGGHELVAMWPYMYCAISSLQLGTVINVHSVHCALLVILFIYIYFPH